MLTWWQAAPHKSIEADRFKPDTSRWGYNCKIAVSGIKHGSFGI